MKINLSTKEVVNFLKRAKTVRPNSILPVLSCVSYKDGVFTKSSLDIFYSYTVENGEKGEVLLDEKILTAFMNDVGGVAESITVSIESGKVYLKYGSQKIGFPATDFSTYPIFPEYKNDFGEPIPDSVWDAIYSCKGLTVKDNQLYGGIAYVNVTPDAVYASDRAVVYAHEEKTGMMDTLLMPSTISAMVGLTSIQHLSEGNFDHFQSGPHHYAFIKVEDKLITAAFKQYIQGCTKEEGIEFSKSVLISFCDYVTSTFPGPLPGSALKCEGGDAQLSLLPNEYQQEASRNLAAISGNWIPPVTKFNPHILAPFLKAIPGDTVRLSPYKNNEHLLTVTVPEYPAFSGIVTGMNI